MSQDQVQSDSAVTTSETSQVQTEGQPPASGATESNKTAPTESQSEIFLRLARLDREKAEMERELRQYRQQEAPTKPQFSAKYLAENPLEAVKAAGIDPDYLVNRILADKLGDAAPAELRKQAEQLTERQRLELRLKEMEEKIASSAPKPPDPVQQYVEEYANSVRTFIKPETISAQYPAAAKLAASDPDYVFDQVMYVVNRDADAKLREGRTHEAPLTPQQALEALEKRWASLSGQPAQEKTADGATGAKNASAPSLASVQVAAVSPDAEPADKMPEWGTPQWHEAVARVAEKIANRRI